MGDERWEQPRIFEWLMATLMFVVGCYIVALSDALPASHMRLIMQSMPPVVLGGICILVGGYRVAVLALNGYVRNVNVRVVLAALSAAVWGQMVFAFGYRVWAEGSTAPPGLLMLTWQLFGEIWLVFKLRRGPQRR